MKGKRTLQVWAVLALLVSLGVGVGGATSAMDELGLEGPAGTAFTYQGQLRDGSGPVNATCDLEFKLWDALEGGAQVGSTIPVGGLLLEEGLFTVRLDFGAAAFRGQARYLEVSASCPAGSGWATLERQELTGSPYALWALGSPWTGLDGVPGDLADGDQDTTYTAGIGLDLVGTEFLVEFAGNGAADTASRSDHHHDAAYVNEGQASSVSTGMVQNGTLLLEDLNQNSCDPGEIIKWSGGAWACALDQTVAGSYWSLSGNAGTAPGANYLGTSDNAALELKVNGMRALRLEPNSASPNLVGGYSGNLVTAGVSGATIGGGGSGGLVQLVTDTYGTVGGGGLNQAGNADGTLDNASYATVAGGSYNVAGGPFDAIGGGFDNRSSSDASTIAGGASNRATGYGATVGGGVGNEATAEYATIAGGAENHATAAYGTVAGGGPSVPADPETTRNRVVDSYGTVGGGGDNLAGSEDGNPNTHTHATVAGGLGNTASSHAATVGGGRDNSASEYYATVGGGYSNSATDQYAIIGGGYGNSASGWGSTIGGGVSSQISADYATIGGGGPADPHNPESYNRVSDSFGTVGGGGDNQAGNGDGDLLNASFATVGGGETNSATAQHAIVGGGRGNAASAQYATVGGGYLNIAEGYQSTIAGGADNSAGYRATVGGGLQNDATGDYGTVPGGYANVADGTYSFAAGNRAKANNAGCFVWGDSYAGDVPCDNDNRTIFRSTGGFYVYTNSGLSTGTYIAAGANSWSGVSDRATKENFDLVDTQALLDTLAGMPVQEYNLRSQDPSIRHIGPVAQDFSVFGYGESDRAINMQDADGVALAAIQGLYDRVQALEAENDELQARLAALEAGQGAGASPARLPGGWLLLGGGVLAVGVVAGGRRAWGGGR